MYPMGSYGHQREGFPGQWAHIDRPFGHSCSRCNPQMSARNISSNKEKTSPLIISVGAGTPIRILHGLREPVPNVACGVWFAALVSLLNTRTIIGSMSGRVVSLYVLCSPLYTRSRAFLRTSSRNRLRCTFSSLHLKNQGRPQHGVQSRSFGPCARPDRA